MVGFAAWVAVAWTAFSDIDRVTPESDEGGQLMTWALIGTVMMILGAIFLHLAQGPADRETSDEHRPPS